MPLQPLVVGATKSVMTGALHWYWLPIAALFAVLVILVVVKDRAPVARSSALRWHDIAFAVGIVAVLVAVRWPTLGYGELDGDESVALSAAITRWASPRFGLSLFTGSAGPWITYSLALLGLLGLQLDYGAAKLMGLLLTAGSLAFVYLGLRSYAAPRPARIAVLPLLVLAGACTFDWEISYCSEHWIRFSLALSLFLLARLDAGSTRRLLPLGLGVSLGWMPLIKWQGVPMSAVLTIAAIALLVRRPRALLLLLLGGVLPSALWVAILSISGDRAFFLDTYVGALFGQVAGRYPTTMWQRLQALPDWGLATFHLDVIIWCVAAFVVAGLVVVLVRRAFDRTLVAHGAFVVLLFVASTYAILQPGGRFPHYLNLLTLPLWLCAGLAFVHFVRTSQRTLVISVMYCVALLGVPAWLYSRTPSKDPWWDGTGRSPQQFVWKSAPRTLAPNPTATALSEFAPPGSRMILWGWNHQLQVRSGMIWGSPTGASHEIIERFFDRDFFTEVYVRALREGKAPIFVDGAMKGDPVYVRPKYRHENFPVVAAAVAERYFFCAELPNARLFLQRATYENDAVTQARCASLRGDAPASGVGDPPAPL